MIGTSVQLRNPKIKYEQFTEFSEKNEILGYLPKKAVQWFDHSN